jgi:hypothetical protein
VNLRLLCPNCHSQTDTYCAKNLRLKNLKREGMGQVQAVATSRYKIVVKQIIKKSKCIDCSTPIVKNATRCVPCHLRTTRKVTRPPLETLLKEIKETSYLAVGKKYGVTDNSVRKWIKHYNGLKTK